MGKRADMTTSVIADGMLREILLYPEAGPRLEYADWLDEHGDPERAEFVRVQCELVKKDGRGDYPGEPNTLCTICQGGRRGYIQKVGDSWVRQACAHCWESLRRREQKLLQTGPMGRLNWLVWANPINELFREFACDNLAEGAVSIGGPRFMYGRGFVEEISCRKADWYGETCHRCRGDGRFYSPSDISQHEKDCSACSGTGRIGGHGPAIVLTQPIMVARLTDEPDADSRLAIAWARQEAGLVV
jgi:uncharacterized protein (TIGR02996 family)